MTDPALADLQRQIDAINEKLRVFTQTPAGRDYEIIQRLKRAETQRIKPEPISLLVTGEHGMALKFSIQIPAAPSPSDITKGVLSVTVAGNPLPDLDVGLEAGDVTRDDFVGSDNDQVQATLVYHDDAGNQSQASTISAALLDTIPPPAPGELGLIVTGETHEPT